MVQSSIQLDQLMPEPPPSTHGGCGSCGSGKTSERCGNGLEKIYPTTAVRFGYMRYIGEFSHAPDVKFTCGARVIIQTRRGIEIGEQVSLSCGGCDKSVTRDKMKAWVESCGEDSYVFDAGRILREATSADLAEYSHIQAENLARRTFCRQVAFRYNLPIKIVECEQTFGGEKVIFYFTSEQRVDFRPLVRDLAQEYRTRIEARQIGARDEARLLADYETCGREVCCKVFLKTLRPISMRMAKLQKATLDPSQVSGRCGRLKCCLRYEHASYEDLDKQLPKVGVRIRTNHGEGVVVNRQILTQLVQIRTDVDKILTVVAEDITEVGVPTPVLPPPDMSARSSADPGPRGRGPGVQRGLGRPTSEPGVRPPPPGRRQGRPLRDEPIGPSQPPPPAGPRESRDSGPQSDQGARRRRRRRPPPGGQRPPSSEPPPRPEE